jgi:hypothetical protein
VFFVSLGTCRGGGDEEVWGEEAGLPDQLVGEAGDAFLRCSLKRLTITKSLASQEWRVKGVTR